jgi:hypothetical protein
MSLFIDITAGIIAILGMISTYLSDQSVWAAGWALIAAGWLILVITGG